MKLLATILVDLLAVIGAAAVLGALWLRWKFRKTVRERMAQMKEEEKIPEHADWIGKTGLDEETERELPRYLRREFGESLSEESSLKASSLRYVGAFDENGGRTHYWHIPYGDEKNVFAYVDVAPDGSTCTGWGNREPPRAHERPGA